MSRALEQESVGVFCLVHEAVEGAVVVDIRNIAVDSVLLAIVPVLAPRNIVSVVYVAKRYAVALYLSAIVNAGDPSGGVSVWRAEANSVAILVGDVAL